MQVFPDGWCLCHSCSERFHISYYFDEFKDPDFKPKQQQPKLRVMAHSPVPVATESTAKPEYTKYELFPLWESLPELPRTFDLKGIPIEVLDNLGWRWTDGVQGMGAGVFIPYFNHARTSVPFAQVRHITGDRRFTMLPGAEMTLYGKWNLHPGEKLFIVEGCSDAAVLDYACVPWVAIPSAAGGAMIANLAKYALKTGINLIYAGDNDEAGDKLKKALDEVAPYRVCQPPEEYKDWGDFLVGTDIGTVTEYCWNELREPELPPMQRLAMDVFSEQGAML